MTYRRPKALLCYSSRHFSPGKNTGKEQTSAGLLARCLYEVLTEKYEVVYQDKPELEAADRVVSPYIQRCLNLKSPFKISFPAIAHPRYTDEIVRREAAVFKEGAPHYVYEESEIEEFERGFHAADKILAIGNEFIRKTFLNEGISTSKVKIIPSAVDTGHYPFEKRESSLDSPIFLHSATLVSVRKGIHYLLDAWRTLHSFCPKARLWIAGGIGQEKTWQGKINQPGVEYLGPYENGSAQYKQWLKEAHFIVFPSLSEGQPGTVLEAMASGCVPVTTLSSGVDAELYGGYSLEKATTEGLADKMIQAIQSRDWFERAKTAREMTLRFHSIECFKEQIRKELEIT